MLPDCSSAADSAFGPAVDAACRSFDFTLLFEQTVLGLLPAGIFAIYFAIRLVTLARTSTKTLRSRHTWLKLFVAGCLLALQVASLASWANQSYRTQVSVSFAALNVVVAAETVLLSWLEDFKSIRPSSALVVYLLLTSLLDAAQCRTLWLQLGQRDALTSLCVATTVLKFVLALLESRNKRTSLHSKFKELSPESTGGIVSHSLLWWVNSLFRLGFRSIIRPQDLFPLGRDMSSAHLASRMREAWDARKRPERRFEVPLAALKVLWFPLLQVVFPRICLIGLTFSQPFLIHRVLDLLQERESDARDAKGYGLIGATGLIYFGMAVVSLHYHIKVTRFITMFRGMTIGLIYEHLLQLPIGACSEGAATTLMSADVERIAETLTELNECWARTIEVALGISLLTWQLGWVSVMPLAIVFVSFLGIGRISSRMGAKQKTWLNAVQERITITTTMLSEMKSVKMMGLSPFFSKEVQNQRVAETKRMASLRWLLVWQNVVQNIPWAIVPAVTFTVYAAQAIVQGKSSLQTTKAFTSLSIITLVTDPAAKLLSAIPATASSVGCFDRVQAFLVTLPRADPRDLVSESDSLNDGSGAIELGHIMTQQAAAIQVDNLTIRPDTASATAILKNSTFSINPSALTIITGPVGSGKTTLLKAILGELPHGHIGSITALSKRIGYCAQTAWLPNDSIERVICGPSQDTIDNDWYRACLHACDLNRDISLLPQGDQTMSGSGSSQLSGGQKLRIALARAVYSRPDIMLLDDVLSGLDNRTQAVVLERLFGAGGLLRRLGTTIVLATHSAAALQFGDVFLAIKDRAVFELPSPELAEGIGPAKDTREEAPVQSLSDEAGKVAEVNQLEDLTRATGDFAVYKYYFGRVGWALMGSFFTFNATEAFCSSFGLIWLKWWTDANGGQISLYMPVYLILSVLTLVGMLGYCWILLIRISPKTARDFHKTLLTSVMRAPMAFFSKTDTGSLLNRFSQDMTLIETQLVTGVVVTVSNLLGSLAAAALVCSGSSYMSVTLPVLIAIVAVLQHVYLRTSRQLRLLDIEAKSPLLTHFVESLDGLATIRALGWERHFIERGHLLLDESQKPFYLLNCIQRWLALVLDLIVGAEAILVIGLAVGLRQSTSPGLLGVSLNNILLFSASLSGLITGWTILETSLGSIARLKAFEETVPSEDKGEDMAAWPSDGTIEYKDVTATYENGNTGISNVSIQVTAGQKLALCGRTGSGKSTFVAALLRLLDPSGGILTIDGVDISTVRPDFIRQGLLTLPQDALLIPGSVRLNLSPTDQVSDAVLLDALERVNLAEHFSSIGLDGDIPGDFLSHGQKQLLALARAVVKKKLHGGRILVLDEAMSSVDAASDAIMQRVVRDEFSDCTIVAVVHRVDTIMDFDLVAVLDKGKIMEVGRPMDLKHNGGWFSQLCS